MTTLICTAESSAKHMSNLQSARTAVRCVTRPQPAALVVIDSAVAEARQLAAGVFPGFAVVILDPLKDGVAQITQAIATQATHGVALRELHLISHGAPGCLFLGEGELSLTTLDRHAAALQRWFDPSWFDPSEPAQLLLYGCQVAAGDAGAEFLEKLHGLTGAGISASTTPIGQASLGGNWVLDATRGEVGAPARLAIAPETQASYAGILGWVVASKVFSISPDADAPNNDTTIGVVNPDDNLNSNDDFNDLVTNEQFGYSVAIGAQYAVVGIPDDNPLSDNNPQQFSPGAAYVYAKQPDGSWKPVQKLTAADFGADEALQSVDFGHAVAITSYVNAAGVTIERIVIGDPKATVDTGDANAPNNQTQAGRVYVFDRNPEAADLTQAWEPLTILEVDPASADENALGIAGDQFGSAVAASGKTIVVGAPFDESDGPVVESENVEFANAGAAYVIELDEAGTSSSTKLFQADVLPEVNGARLANDNFGSSVSINVFEGVDGDGQTTPITQIIIGSPNQDTFYFAEPGAEQIGATGAAFVYTNAGGTWTQAAVLLAEQGDRDVDDKFGQAVSIYGDYAIVGAPQDDIKQDENSNITVLAQDAGAVYVFKRNTDGTWDPVPRRLLGTSPTGDIADLDSLTEEEVSDLAEDRFGTSVALSQDFFLVGAPTAGPSDGRNLTPGAVFLYELNQETATPQWEQIEVIQLTKAAVDANGNEISFAEGEAGNEILDGGIQPGAQEKLYGIENQPALGTAVAIYQNPIGGSQALIGAPADVSVLGQDDLLLSRPDDDLVDVENSGAVYFLRTLPEVVDVIVNDDADLIVSDNNVGTASANAVTPGFSFTIVYSEGMDPSIQPTIEFPNEQPGGTLVFNAAQSEWITYEGVANKAFVARYDVVDLGVEIADLDLKITGAKNPDGLEQEPAQPDSELVTDIFDIDTKNPTVTLFSATPEYFNQGIFSIAATFSEAIAPFDEATFFSFTNGSASLFNITSTSPTIFDFILTPAAEGEVTASLPQGIFTDLAGNPSEAANSITRIYDVTSPSVVLTTDLTGPTNQPFTVIADFGDNLSPAILGFEASDISFGPGNNFVASEPVLVDPVDGTKYSFTVTPNPGAANTVQQLEISIGAGVATDLATNPNTASNVLNVTYDGEVPTVVLAGPTEPVLDETFEVTVTFSEVVTGFQTFTTAPATLEDLLIDNGSVTQVVPVAGSDTAYTLTIAPSQPGPVTISVKPGAAIDVANNPNAASAVFEATYAPIVFENDPPDIQFLQNGVLQEVDPAAKIQLNGNGSLTFSQATGNVLTLDDDALPTQSLQVTLSVTPNTGSLTLGTIEGLIFSTGTGTADASMTFTGTEVAINAALDGLRFKPLNVDADASITIEVNDLGNNGPENPPLELIDTQIINLDLDAVTSEAKNDFDQDGSSDILWVNPTTNEISIWFMDGDTKETEVAFTLPDPYNTWNIRGTGDFNGDGTPDLLLREDATGKNAIVTLDPTDLGAQTVNIVADDVDEIESRASQWSIRGVGDFDGDGQEDIIWNNTSTGQYSVWYMNGDQTKKSEATFGPIIGDRNWQIEAVGDFNDDVRPDLVLRNLATGQNLIWIMDGITVTQAVSLPPVSRDWVLAGSGDYNNDQQADILWQNPTTGANVLWQMNGTSIANRITLEPRTDGALIVQN